MTKSIIRKILVWLGFSEVYCPQCGSEQITSHGYHTIECYDCGEETYLENGNLAMEGKAHLYKGFYSHHK